MADGIDLGGLGSYTGLGDAGYAPFEQLYGGLMNPQGDMLGFASMMATNPEGAAQMLAQSGVSPEGFKDQVGFRVGQGFDSAYGSPLATPPAAGPLLTDAALVDTAKRYGIPTNQHPADPTQPQPSAAMPLQIAPAPPVVRAPSASEAIPGAGDVQAPAERGGSAAQAGKDELTGAEGKEAQAKGKKPLDTNALAKLLQGVKAPPAPVPLLPKLAPVTPTAPKAIAQGGLQQLLQQVLASRGGTPLRLGRG
jgi:hypothetical protein